MNCLCESIAIRSNFVGCYIAVREGSCSVEKNLIAIYSRLCPTPVSSRIYSQKSVEAEEGLGHCLSQLLQSESFAHEESMRKLLISLVFWMTWTKAESVIVSYPACYT